MNQKDKFQLNNNNLQSLVLAVKNLKGGSDDLPEITFVPTNSGGTSFKSKFSDNNVDLEKLLNLAKQLPDLQDDLSFLIDFRYYKDEDSYVLTGWKGTLNGVYSSELVIPNDNRIIL